MPSSLFTTRNNSNNPLAMMTQLKKTIDSIRSGNADALSEQMQRSNPQFAQFVRQNRGKSAEQILQESGINADELYSILDMLK